MCIKIKLEKIIDVQRFVSKASKYEDLVVNCENCVVKASSLMGVLSLNLDKPINLCWNDNRLSDKVISDFKEWRCTGGDNNIG